MLSEFSVTPTNSLNDEGEGDSDEAHSPNPLQKGRAIPSGQLGDPKSLDTLVPFPPTPDHSEVSEPGPSKTASSGYDVKNSIYFKEMAKWKETKKLPKNKSRNTTGSPKQPRLPIAANPLKKTGAGTGVKRAVKAATKAVQNNKR